MAEDRPPVESLATLPSAEELMAEAPYPRHLVVPTFTHHLPVPSIWQRGHGGPRLVLRGIFVGTGYKGRQSRVWAQVQYLDGKDRGRIETDLHIDDLVKDWRCVERPDGRAGPQLARRSVENAHLRSAEATS